jgi:hypothetical protein
MGATPRCKQPEWEDCVMPHFLSDFTKFAGTDFQPDVLPIIPAGAKLKPESVLSPEHLGRIPGRHLASPGAWTGFASWQTHEADKYDLGRWESWQMPGNPIAVGLNTRRFHAFDIDSEKAEIADTLEILITIYMGASSVVRLRHGSFRRVLFYEHDKDDVPIRKHRLAFKDAGGDHHAVEFLGAGQQVIIEGPHANGAMHYWRDGIGLIEGREKLAANKVTREIVAVTMRAISDWVDETVGLEKVKLGMPTGSDRAAAIKIGTVRNPHLAKDMDLLARAVRAIDLNHESLADYDVWCALLRAICAACDGDMNFYDDAVWPWLQTNPANVVSNGEARMEAKWRSFHDSQVGADFVYGWAATFGCLDGLEARARDIF